MASKNDKDCGGMRPPAAPRPPKPPKNGEGKKAKK